MFANAVRGCFEFCLGRIRHDDVIDRISCPAFFKFYYLTHTFFLQNVKLSPYRVLPDIPGIILTHVSSLNLNSQAHQSFATTTLKDTAATE